MVQAATASCDRACAVNLFVQKRHAALASRTVQRRPNGSRPGPFRRNRVSNGAAIASRRSHDHAFAQSAHERDKRDLLTIRSVTVQTIIVTDDRFGAACARGLPQPQQVLGHPFAR